MASTHIKIIQVESGQLPTPRRTTYRDMDSRILNVVQNSRLQENTPRNDVIQYLTNLARIINY